MLQLLLLIFSVSPLFSILILTDVRFPWFGELLFSRMLLLLLLRWFVTHLCFVLSAVAQHGILPASVSHRFFFLRYCPLLHWLMIRTSSAPNITAKDTSSVFDDSYHFSTHKNRQLSSSHLPTKSLPGPAESVVLRTHALAPRLCNDRDDFLR